MVTHIVTYGDWTLRLENHTDAVAEKIFHMMVENHPEMKVSLHTAGPNQEPWAEVWVYIPKSA